MPLRSQGYCGVGGASRDSAGFVAMEEGLISSGGRNLRLPLCFVFKIGIPWCFPGDSVVKNLPASAGDMGSIPGWGGSHMLWSN